MIWLAFALGFMSGAVVLAFVVAAAEGVFNGPTIAPNPTAYPSYGGIDRTSNPYWKTREYGDNE